MGQIIRDQSEIVTINRRTGAEITSGNYFWGWYTYRDIFDSTPVHLTEFCQVIAGVIVGRDEKGNVVMNAELGFTFYGCANLNCADQECPDYARIISMKTQPLQPLKPITNF